jgi:hypothetical protein
MSREHLERLSETLIRLEGELQARGQEMRDRTRGVESMIRALALAMGVLALANLYFVNALTEEVKLTVGALHEMSGHFAQVAGRMDRMTGTVEAMDRNVALMPVMRDQLWEIGGQVDRMGQDVDGMRRTTAAMDGRMGLLNAGVFDMSQRFRGLNRSVSGMGADVDQMARPIP